LVRFARGAQAAMIHGKHPAADPLLAASGDAL
jgi:hypothetical protein